MKKRISLIAALFSVTLFSYAQQKKEYTTGTSFGLRGGVNFQNVNGKDEDGKKLENDIITGFHIGVNAEIPVAPGFYFQPGVLYTIKGAKNTDVFLGQTIKSTARLSYIEVPLNLVYKPVLGTGRLLLGFGPYVAFGIGGDVKFESGNNSETHKIKYKKMVLDTDPDDVAYFRPMDAGANFLFGYEFTQKISLQLNAQLGLVKINPEYEGEPNDQSSAKNTGFGFSLGYRF